MNTDKKKPARHVSNAVLDKLTELREEIEHAGEVERIVCSAIWFQTKENHLHQPNGDPKRGRWGGLTICGLRHHNCFYTASLIDKGLRLLHHEQGFLTSANVFVDRRQAAAIAFTAGQTATLKKELFSEDLW